MKHISEYSGKVSGSGVKRILPGVAVVKIDNFCGGVDKNR